MQIVINIDEKLYSDIKTIGIAMGKIEYILEAIKHGVVLPKGHGINELPISSIDITDKNNLGVDCIDRAKAQTEIEMNAFRYTLAKERGGTGKVEWDSHLISIDDAVDIIRNMPSVTPQEPRWISVSERLPDEGGNYLITNVFEIVKGENPVKEVRRDYFCVLSQKWLYEGDNVIAWMPLPKPYKPQESEKEDGNDN